MRGLAALVISIGALAVGPVAAMADSPADNHATYAWVVGFTVAPDIAMAPDGSTIAMTGRGTLETGPDRKVTGGGTYHKSNGGSGTWTATAADSFVSYGPSTIDGFFGGEAKLRVTLSNGQSGVLTIFCDAPGSNPPTGKAEAEGINLILGAGASDEYTTQVSGNTVFIHT
jgi:hypothetical protein